MSFDLDAVIDEEAKGDQPDPFTFDFDGNTYTLPGRLDARALAAIDSGRVDRAVRALAGPEQWSQIEGSTKVLTLRTMDTLMGEWVRHCAGTTVGKSSRSGGRSKTTRTPSKRTSRATTTSASPSSVPAT